MFIKDIYKNKASLLSLEVFPPKINTELESILDALKEMAALEPGFISVTYGAGGTGLKGKTVEIASYIKNTLGCEPMAHLTVVGKTRAEVREILERFQDHRIENILALRGDVGENYQGNADFPYAKDLIAFIKEHGGFGIGGAFYPEGHIDCDCLEANFEHMRQKEAAGADFLISQLFFDNEMYLRFIEKARDKGVTLPLVAGIMPIMSKSQVQRMIFQCGVSLPSGIVRILHKYEHRPEDLQKAGIDYANQQIETLVRNGHKHIHLYSMNKPQIARACKAFYDQAVRAQEEGLPFSAELAQDSRQRP